MKILVTGGAGFIGSHICEALLKRGDEVICVDNFDNYYDPKIKRENVKKLKIEPKFTLIESDIKDKEAMGNIFNKYKIDKVIHLAAKVGVRPSIEDPLSYMENNIIGTLNILEQSKKHNVKYFILGSSSSVYGDRLKCPFSEKDEAKPISPYAASKKSCEELCFTYHSLHNLKVCCLRFFTVYGPRGRPDMAIANFTRLIDQDKPIPVYGDGNSKRDYTYIADIVKGVLSATDAEFNFEIINLGSNNPIQLTKLISLIGKNLGKQPKIENLPEQQGDVPFTFADISKANKLLGYQPSVSIEEGIKNFVLWYKNNKKAFLQ